MTDSIEISVKGKWNDGHFGRTRTGNQVGCLSVSNYNSNGRWGLKEVVLAGQHYRYVRI